MFSKAMGWYGYGSIRTLFRNKSVQKRRLQLTDMYFFDTVRTMYAGKTEEWNEYLLLATTALYRVTKLLPVDEPLRTALREYANRVLAGRMAEMHGAARGSSVIESDIEALLGFIAVARTLPEVKRENFLVLEREYRALRVVWAQETKAEMGRVQREEDPLRAARADHGLLRKERRVPSRVGIVSVKSDVARERQREILERLAKTSQAKISDFYEIFHGVSPKTIQRDLQDLVARNAVKKEGERRWTVYTLPESTSL